MNIAERIRQSRKGKGLTQQNLADKLGLSYMTVRRWETGKTSPRMDEIEKLSKILGVDRNYIIEGENAGIDTNNVSIDKASSNMAYWIEIIDNVYKLIEHGNSNEISLVTTLLKSAYETIVHINLSEKYDSRKLINADIHHNDMKSPTFTINDFPQGAPA